MKLKVLAAAVAAAAIGVSATFAANLAVDDASDPVYNPGWSTGQNGGSGWGAWTLNVIDDGDTNINAGHFVGNSILNGNGLDDGNLGGVAGDGDINIPANDTGRAWGEFANTRDTAEAFRSFTGGALGVGQVFDIDMDNGFIDQGNTVGLALQNASGQNLFEFFFTGGNATYSVNDGGGVSATTVGFGDEGVHVRFQLTAPTTYQVNITRRDGVSDVVTGSLISQGDQNVQQVRLFNANAGSGSSNDAFFNSMSVAVPEPSTLALLGISALGLVAFRRRR